MWHHHVCFFRNSLCWCGLIVIVGLSIFTGIPGPLCRGIILCVQDPRHIPSYKKWDPGKFANWVSWCLAFGVDGHQLGSFLLCFWEKAGAPVAGGQKITLYCCILYEVQPNISGSVVQRGKRKQMAPCILAWEPIRGRDNHCSRVPKSLVWNLHFLILPLTSRAEITISRWLLKQLEPPSGHIQGLNGSFILPVINPQDSRVASFSFGEHITFNKGILKLTSFQTLW